VSRTRTPTVSPSLSHRLNVLALVLTALIVVTGGAVRLTGSGLGCSDWPDCSVGHLTPPVQFHSLVEFGNRLVTVVMVIVVAAAFLGAVFRVPRRRDLMWLSGGLVAGVLVIYSIELFELRLGVDDPGGSVSVHAVAGLWGILAMGLFGQSPGQLVAQIVGIATLIGFVFPLTYGMNFVLNRVSPFRTDS